GGRVGYRRVGVRLVEGAPVAARAGEHHGASVGFVLGDRTAVVGVLVGAGVRRVGAVVAHHPQPPLRDGDVEGRVGGGVVREEVVLVQGDAVDGDAALRVAALDVVAADADDPLDEV